MKGLDEVIEESKEANKRKLRKLIRAALDAHPMNEDCKAFCASVSKFLEERGFLTEKQIEALQSWEDSYDWGDWGCEDYEYDGDGWGGSFNYDWGMNR